LLLAAALLATEVAAVVVSEVVLVLPLITVTLTIFGFAIVVP